MFKIFKFLMACILAVTLLMSCSGGSGGSDEQPELGTFSLSGTVTIGNSIDTDSDNNDLSSEYADNSTLLLAQNVANATVINGFVTKVATNNLGDRFESVNDEFDVYRLLLGADQLLRLEIADFNASDDQENDIDLGLFDLSGNIIATSESFTNIEEITISTAGEYFVVVRAFAGSSKYLLNTSAPSISSQFAPMRNNNVEFLIPNQAIVEYMPEVQTQARSFSAASVDTASSIVLEQLDSNVGASLSISSTKRVLSNFEQGLKTLNLASFEKIQTLERIKTLSLLETTKHVSPNYMRQVKRVPNDEFYERQWHYGAMNLPAAWDVTTGFSALGNDVVVAVVDSGVVLDHEDLRDKLVTGYDFISSSENALDGDGIDDNPDDPGDKSIEDELTGVRTSSWHGTHVAGTVAASSDNNIGVAGVSWGAKIMPLRVCGQQGCSLYDTLQAISYAAGLPNDSGTIPSQTADIINLSLGGFGYSAVAEGVYQQVIEQGLIVVASAGNDNLSTLNYPASYPGVISVSALNAASEKASYSSFGAQIDIAAPGGDSGELNGDGFPDFVLSAVATEDERAPRYGYQAGTSMASPHVAGMFALMKAIYPSLTPSDVDALLQSGELTVDIGDAGRDDLYGYGGADALLAVQAAQRLALGNLPDPTIVALPERLVLDSNISSATIVLRNIGGGTPIITDFSANVSWLSVAASDDIDSQNLGSYQIVADLTGLADGEYSAIVSFNSDIPGTTEVFVMMNVGEPDVQVSREVSQLYALVVNPDTATVVEGVEVSLSDGVYSYRVTDIAAGSYAVVISTDVDNNNIYCEPAEACGIYADPSSNNIVSLNDSLESLDILVEISSILNTNRVIFNSGQIQISDNESLSNDVITKNIGELFK